MYIAVRTYVGTYITRLLLEIQREELLELDIHRRETLLSAENIGI